jgi:hypothetical protein
MLRYRTEGLEVVYSRIKVIFEEVVYLKECTKNSLLDILVLDVLPLLLLMRKETS